MEPLAASAGIWSVMPPLVAIVLALVTKEVIFSLVVGIMSGALIYSVFAGLGVFGIFTVTVDIMIYKLGDPGNAAIIIFLALLGALVALIVRAGGSNAYGAWATKRIKTQRKAGLLTALLGLIMFIDDYFNCLTVGTIMRPVTDRQRISREKLAYLVDSTAAPISVIAPISSWAAAIISFYPANAGVTGMQAFISSIPMNLYALLTIFMVFWFSTRKGSDYGPMALAQRRAEESGVVESGNDSGAAGDELDRLEISSKGKVIDLVLPVMGLIIFSVLAMLWSGGFFNGEGKSVFDSFGDTSAGLALALGGFISLLLAFFLYVPRKLFSFADFFSGLGAGVKSMVPALIILSLAWSISGICQDRLLTDKYVAGLVAGSVLPVALIPAIMFSIAAGLAFSIGSSWGTFSLLIPIGIAICNIQAPHLSVLTLSSTLAGAVFGDHCSPISDTTILAATGARCAHIDHVTTQLPYAATAALVCIPGYILSGFLAEYGYWISVVITLLVSMALLVGLLLYFPKLWKARNLSIRLQRN
jgi:Na+/H+ antiporter NhaC